MYNLAEVQRAFKNKGFNPRPTDETSRGVKMSKTPLVFQAHRHYHSQIFSMWLGS